MSSPGMTVASRLPHKNRPSRHGAEAESALNSLKPLEVNHSTLIDARLEAAVRLGMLRITSIRPFAF